MKKLFTSVMNTVAPKHDNIAGKESQFVIKYI